jgi:glutathione S-transferase
MILIGQYDSPFVRRVGIALTLYGIAYEHRPWASFGEADKIRPYNPLTRVPTLVLDDGDVLIDSAAIIDYLDNLVPAEKRMFPQTEPARRRAIKIATVAAHTADKGVILFYEKALHQETSDLWVSRCRTQISAGLDLLEKDRASRKTEFWFGDRIGHADIAVTAALRFINDAHGGVVSIAEYPALKAHYDKHEAMPVFQKVSQEFIAPA